MKFHYVAKTSQGKVRSGLVEALSQAEALQVLQSHNLVVLRLEKSESFSLFSKRLKIFERVKRKEVFVFFRELAILVGAGVPLVQSLTAMSRQIENVYLREVVSNLAKEVSSGTALSKAMAKYPKVFSIFSVNLIKSGEVAGRLHQCLEYLADFLEKEYYLISKIRGAMIYPVFILFVFLVVGVVVMVMVIPQLTSILVEVGQDLPLSTRVVIWSSDFVRQWGFWIFLVLAIAGLAFWRYQKTENGKALWDSFVLKIPIFGRILKKTYLARSASNLSSLLKGGVSLIKALGISGEVIGNTVYRDIIWQARDDVKVGRSISDSLLKHKEFPPLYIQMVKTGEQTGKIDSILEKLSSFYNREVDNIVNNLSQLIEPVLLVILGIGVAILVFSVFMPIYNLAGGL